MTGLARVYSALNTMHEDGIFESYAIGGGMAAMFYAEVTRTYDVDVFALIPATGFLVSLSGIYEWARRHGFEANQEHILIHGVPVQFLSARDGLEEEAVNTARVIDYAGVPVRVMAPEYLVAIYQLTGGEKRRGRARTLYDAKTIDSEKLRDIIKRFNLEIPQWDEGGSDSEN